jgi:dTMP kinase
VKRAGRFISFEGGEGAGKTTLIEGVADALAKRGLAVLKVREPGGTKLGEAARNLLLHVEGNISPYAELCLFLASRAQHLAEVIEPALREGKIVLCDRFNDSSVAYQGLGRGLGMDTVGQICELVCHGITPELTFYLDIDPAVGLARVRSARGTQDRIESETLAFHQKIREAYHLLHKKYPRRLHLLDASQPPAHVLAQALACLTK